ncbi:MAG: beta-glucosidase BglX [Flavobacteriaceae bacterium]|nr:beta-glucosidase BglX [Flavobacteriaceae bacterium]
MKKLFTIKLVFLYIFLAGFLFSCTELFSNGNGADDLISLDQKVETLLSKMTLEEKIGQMNQYNGFWDFTGPAPKGGHAEKKYDDLKNGLVGSMLNVRGVKDVTAVQKVAVEQSRLGIPLIIGFDVIHGYKTISPIPIAEAASWDLDAIKKSAEMAALESSAAGINWTFAPMVDISRDARWGRVMEGAGEDPYLGSKIAEARVNGFQGNNLSLNSTIAACAKHFAAYGFAEGGRDYNTVDIGTSTLYNMVFPPFIAAKNAGVKTFMNSFNELNGVPATGNKYLQRDILKEEWAYDGFIVSDWGSITEMIAHGHAKDGKHAAELALNAGSDMDMESHLYVKHLENLVGDDKVDLNFIDDATRRILKVKYELGLFDDPYKYCNLEREKEITGSEEINNAALDIAKKSIVLLKNNNNLLPLKKEGQKIALIGALASDKTSPLGSWRIAADDNTAISVLEGMNQYSGNTVTFAKGADLTHGKTEFVTELKINTTDKSEFKKAKEVARNADVVVMVLGEHGFQSGEGRSRASLDLPGVQQELLEEIFSVNSNIVLVLNNGRPLAINWADENIPAILEAWQLGTQSGHAIAQVLYGDYNPSGKLPMTFPRNVGQVPLYYNYKNTGRPNLPGPDSVFWSHYNDEENTPLYPFGYGLSYSTFKYSNLSITNNFEKNSKIEITIDVKNTGTIEGKEVVQLYIRDKYASITRPVKELKGFELLNLKAGETKAAKFELTEKELGFYDNEGKWILEKGEFEVYVGTNSQTQNKKSFELK